MINKQLIVFLIYIEDSYKITAMKKQSKINHLSP